MTSLEATVAGQVVAGRFAAAGLPSSLDPGDGDQNVVPRRVPGPAGFPRCFREAGRGFCPSVIPRRDQDRDEVGPGVDPVLGRGRLDPVASR